MAAPVGHIVCALTLLHSAPAKIADPNAFLAGTSFPDIRYISDIKRKVTHYLREDSLDHVFEADSSFEMGRRFHVLVDHAREKHMLKHNAYRFVDEGALRTQMLKLVEDHILFEKLKNNFDANAVFAHSYQEERQFGVSEQQITSWHLILKRYLDQKHWLSITRYFSAFWAFKKAFMVPQNFFSSIWQSVKALSFFIYAYIQIDKLSRNPELRSIILDFYENKVQQIIQEELPEIHVLDPPLEISLDQRYEPSLFIASIFDEADFLIQA